MCVIVYKPSGQEFNMKELEACSQEFTDGMGYVSFNPATKKITQKKITEGTVEDLLKNWKKIKNHKDHSTFIHFRKASMGEVSTDNTQPLITKRYVFAHNGTISEVRGKVKNGESDSVYLGRNYLDDLNINKASHMDLLKNFIGSDRLIVMNKKTGEVKILNESPVGSWRNKLWYSNLRWSYRMHQSKKNKKNRNKRGGRSQDPSDRRSEEYWNTLYAIPGDSTDLPKEISALPKNAGTGRKVAHKIYYEGPGRVCQDKKEIWLWDDGTVFDINRNQYIPWASYPLLPVRAAVKKYLEDKKKAAQPRIAMSGTVRYGRRRKRKLFGGKVRWYNYYDNEQDIIRDRVFRRDMSIAMFSCIACGAPMMNYNEKASDNVKHYCESCKMSKLLPQWHYLNE